MLTLVAPDGFPFSVRLPIAVDAASAGCGSSPSRSACRSSPGRACVTAHDHHPDFTWQRNFQVRGDLVEDDDGWTLVPRKLVGGFELPPGSRLSLLRRNARDIMRYRRIARAELKRRRA